MQTARSTHPSFAPRPVRGRRALVCAVLWSSLGALLASESTAEAESPPAYVVIVHAKSGIGPLERSALSDIFLKKSARWESGEAALPVDQKSGAAVRDAFSRAVLGRSTAAVRSYWTQRIFSGRDVPPPELEGDKAVIGYVASHVGAVGYVSANATLSGVKPLAVR
ncbi:MAG TPA: hypothetical protein VHP33_12545 [Polyangiaceae bacterium]|nr:hypothetical protein [Polyangiaceae bacterium]